jgi:hypothetical protein
LLLAVKAALLWLTGIGPGHLGKADALRSAALLAGGGEFASWCSSWLRGNGCWMATRIACWCW